ncbi:MAG: DUF2325 domain-containing protein [Oscillospiraceae bacterium]
MSVVVVGGNDRMATRYKEVCKAHKCKAKVFIKMPADFESKLGCPDLVIVLTDTVSHKMVHTVNQKAGRGEFDVAHVHSSSISALKNVLAQYCCSLSS